MSLVARARSGKRNPVDSAAVSDAGPPRGAIFDLDGVLIDSGEFHRRSWHRLAQEVGAPMSDAFFRETFGQNNGQILPRLLGRALEAEELRGLSERKEALYREEARGRIRLCAGAEPLLAALRERGFRLAVGSSTPRSNMDFFRRELGLDRLFDALVDGDDVTRGKPDPDVFLEAAERIGVPPARCIVFEDAPAGLEAAARAGMRSIAVASTHPTERLAGLPGVASVVRDLRQVEAAQIATLVRG